jgi:hypothetical protein
MLALVLLSMNLFAGRDDFLRGGTGGAANPGCSRLQPALSGAQHRQKAA